MFQLKEYQQRCLDELADLPGLAGKPLRLGKPAHDGPKVVYG